MREYRLSRRPQVNGEAVLTGKYTAKFTVISCRLHHSFTVFGQPERYETQRLSFRRPLAVPHAAGSAAGK
jgi:hypothetical protein